MRKIGTISSYYPFLKDETKTLIKTVVEVSSNYREFVRNLIDLLYEQEFTIEQFYFTVVQAWFLNDDELWNLAIPLCSSNVVTKPWKYWDNPELSIREFQNGFKSDFEKAVSAKPPDWMLLNLYTVGVYLCLFISDHILTDWTTYIDSISELIKQNPKLQYFGIHQHFVLGCVKQLEGDFDGALAEYEMGLDISNTFDDPYGKAWFLEWIAELMKNINTTKALRLFNESYQLYKDLGDKKSAGQMLASIGWTYTIRGEYDFGLEYYFEGMDIAAGSIESPSPSSTGFSVKVANLYCDMSQSNQALEWIKWRDESLEFDTSSGVAEGPGTYKIILALARTYILEGLFDETEDLLEHANKLVLKWGLEDGLATYYYVLGLYELNTNDSETALQTLNQSIEIWQRLKSQIFINRCLIALASAEIVIATESDSPKDPETSGRWMSQLERHSLENDYPGIQMQHALLKAEYQIEIGETEAAEYTLKDALTFTDSQGVKTIRARIHERLKKLETSVDA